VTPARSVACDDETLYSVSSRTTEHEAPGARAASASAGGTATRTDGAAFGTGDVLRARSDRVDDVAVIWRLGAGARRHAQQLGHATSKRPTARRAAATARPSSRVESSEFSGLGSGSRGTRRTSGTAAIAPWGRVRNCLAISTKRNLRGKVICVLPKSVSLLLLTIYRCRFFY